MPIAKDTRQALRQDVRPWRKASLLILIASLVTGCTTLRTITPDPGVVNNTLRPNNHIRVTKLNGQVLEFTVKEITKLSILGMNISDEDGHLIHESERINLGDISKIERREYSHSKTAGLIVGLAATTVFIVATFFAPGM